MTRHLHERDAARNSGDRLARAVLDHLEGKAVDLRAELTAYYGAEGPPFAAPQGEWMVTRYCPQMHLTSVVTACDSKLDAEDAAAKLKAEAQARGEMLYRNDFRVVQRGSKPADSTDG